jgi:DNA-3-methyladenine glycosylase
MTRLKRDFFERDTAAVARDLLGRLLVHEIDGQRVSGRVVEAEAYMGWDDRASHGFGRITSRNKLMFGLAGFSYVYFIYGNYWMFNVVAKPPGVDYAGAVLIRALEPVEGLEIQAARRKSRSQREWTSGPGRLVLAMGINSASNGVDLTVADSRLYFELGQPIPDEAVCSGPRVGLGRNVPETWKNKAWRFWVAGNPYVSK